MLELKIELCVRVKENQNKNNKKHLLLRVGVFLFLHYLKIYRKSL
jgi:hypothetical protein